MEVLLTKNVSLSNPVRMPSSVWRRIGPCWRANLLSSKRTPVRDLSMKLLRYPRALRRSLKLQRHSSKVVCAEFVLRSLVTSPLIKDQIKHFPKVFGRDWGVVIVKCVVCPTYCSYSLLLWYICIQARDIHRH